MNAPSPNQWTRPTPLSSADIARCAHVSALVDDYAEAVRQMAGLYIRHHCGHTLAPTDFGIREMCKVADDATWAKLDALNKALLELADPDGRHRLVEETDTREPGNMGAALRFVIAREAEGRSSWADHEAGFQSAVA